MATLVIPCAAPGPARATGPGEKQISASLGFALAGTDDSARPGMQAGVEAMMGFTDSWAGRAAVGSSWQPKTGSGDPAHVTAASLGMTYSLDVVRWVPFLDLGVSLADLRGDGASSQRLGPQVGLGAEYLLSRRWTLAALARFDYFALRLRGPGGTQPWWACAGLRIGRVF
ncbi:MAG: outer membrane beta-barrel protein [Polyangia bacterium]